MSSCVETIIKEDLVLFYDISNLKSYDLNSSYTITSLYNWKKYKTDSFILKDYGLTMYDVARTNSLSGYTYINEKDNKLKLYKIGYNDASGNTYYNNYDINLISSSTIGYYFNLNGGYLQNYWKLDKYNYEFLPYRFPNGFTIEIPLLLSDTTFDNIIDENGGIFLYLGTRSENKYSIIFSGETGYTTTLNNKLGSDHENDLEKGINDNIICFKINKDRKLGYKYIDSEGLIKENYSERILSNGWNFIQIVYKPCPLFKDDECGKKNSKTLTWDKIKDCLLKRDGELIFYVNGFKFFKEECFDEQFWFKSLSTDKEKQIGVPYCISFGGGSFGLKHSYHYNPFWRKNDMNLITVGDNGTFENNITGITSSYNLIQDNTIVYSSSTKSLKIYNTGNTFNNRELVIFNNPITLLPNKQYLFSAWLYNDNMFIDNETDGCIRFELSGNTNNLVILEKIGYRQIKLKKQWIKIYIKIQTPKDFVSTDIIPMIHTDTRLDEINTNFNIYLDDVKVEQFDYIENIYSLDGRKNNLKIQNNFDGSFYGGIQKLRFYLKPFNPMEIRNNYNVESELYGLNKIKGGRIINI